MRLKTKKTFAPPFNICVTKAVQQTKLPYPGIAHKIHNIKLLYYP